MKRKLLLLLTIALLCVLPAEARGNHAHLLDGGEVTAEATCKQDGEILYRCLDPDCDYTLTVAVPAGHKFGELVTVTESTCDGRGAAYRVCQVCGRRQNEFIERKGHHMVLSYVLREATCTSSGTSLFECTECGYQERVNYPATGHVMGESVVEKEPTCSSYGILRCSCTAEGCTCSATERIDKTEHRWDEGVKIREASVKETGKIRFTCLDCGEVKYERTPKLTV